MEMPLNMKFEIAKEELAKVINYCIFDLEVPSFIISEILANYLSEVNTLVEQDLNKSQREYSEAQKQTETKEQE